MLILNRRVGETLMISDDVRVTVLGVNGRQVRIGIEAPKTIAVHREEIYRQIQRKQGSLTSSGWGTPDAQELPAPATQHAT